MFDVLTRGFRNAALSLQGKAKLDEENLAPALREVRTSLLQADVELDVVKRFLERVKAQSLGEIVPLRSPTGQEFKIGPQDHFIKSCYDELVALMGPVNTDLSLQGNPSVIMLVGLQGSGKTTTAGKLARRLITQGKKPMLVAADIYRPAAIEQLAVIGRKLNVPVFTIAGMDPVELASKAIIQARNVKRDVVIIDTAGRLALDEALMVELERIKATVKPENLLFVCDAMIGQDAVRTAREFDRRLDFTGFILTKLDGDARGGAALSIKDITGKPVKFLGQGEDLSKLEEFRPEGLAQRILGFGDVVGLMKDFEAHVDEKSAEADAQKLMDGQFGYDDFVRQLQTIRKMGPIRDIIGRLPFFSGILDQIPKEALDDRELDKVMVVISSMTKAERTNPDLLDESRFYRIAVGSGRPQEEVRDLHKRFLQARQMMKGFGQVMKDPGALARMQKAMASGDPSSLFPGMGNVAPKPEKRELSVDEKLDRIKRQRELRRQNKR
jgi:signal recognition particle subunit SRP54